MTLDHLWLSTIALLPAYFLWLELPVSQSWNNLSQSINCRAASQARMDIVLELKRGWIYVLGGTSHSAQPEGPSFTIFYRQHFSQQQNNLKHSKCNKYRGFTSVGKISNFLWKIKRVCKYFTRKFRMWIFSCEDKMTCTLVTRCPIPSHQPPPPHLFQGLDTVVLTWTGE